MPELRYNLFTGEWVVIESPLHDRTLATLSDAQIAVVLDAYRQRMQQLYRLPQVEHVIVFKNHGEVAGSSLIHPHSQVVGTPVLSGQVRQRIENGLKFFGDNGECIYCHCLRKELADGQRILSQNQDYAAHSDSPVHPRVANGWPIKLDPRANPNRLQPLETNHGQQERKRVPIR